MLRAHPEVAAQVQQGIERCFVDEYQDLNPAQVQLLGLLCPDGRLQQVHVGLVVGIQRADIAPVVVG